jgi:hypothetical protein
MGYKKPIKMLYYAYHASWAEFGYDINIYGPNRRVANWALLALQSVGPVNVILVRPLLTL